MTKDQEIKKLKIDLNNAEVDTSYFTEAFLEKLQELHGKNAKLTNQRTQLRMYQEKVELMKGWKGILRTIGQKLGICR